MKRLGKFSLVLLLQLIFAASMLASNANASKGSGDKGSDDKGSTSVSCSEKGSKGSSDKGSKGSEDKGSKSSNGDKRSKDKKGSKNKGSKDKGSKGSEDKGSKGSSDNDCEPQPPVCDDGSDKGSKGSSDKGSKGSSDKGSKGSKDKKGTKDKGSKGSSDKGSKGSKGSSDGGDECNPTAELDFGDAPGYDAKYIADSNGVGSAASHIILPNGPFIGSVAPDAETGPQVSDDLVDINTNQIDDESQYQELRDSDFSCGSTYSVRDASPSAAQSLTISVAPGIGGTAVLSGWIDWNGDGYFDEANESLVPGGAIVASQISIPMDDFKNVPSVVGEFSTYMRIRYSSQYVGPYGPAEDGEVEDCEVFVSVISVIPAP